MRGNSYFLIIEGTETVRIVLAIQSHPVFGPGHQLIKKWPDLKIWGKASRFWNDSADEANAEVSRCSAKFKGLDLRFVVQFKGSELKYQQMERPKDGVALATGKVLKQLNYHLSLTAELSRCSAKFQSSDLRFVVQSQGSELKYQQNQLIKKQSDLKIWGQALRF